MGASLFAPSGGIGKLITPKTFCSGSSNQIALSNPDTLYDLLELYLLTRTDAGAVSYQMNMRFNGDSGSNYGWNLIAQSSGSPTGTQNNNDTEIQLGGICANGAPSDNFDLWRIIIANAKSPQNKQVYIEHNSSARTPATGRIEPMGGYWQNTDDIEDITFDLVTGNFTSTSWYTMLGYAIE